MALMRYIKNLEKFTIDNSPAILTGIGVAGTVTTAFLVGKATFKAADILNERQIKPDLRESVELVWTCYIPPAVTGSLTIAAIVGANHISSRRAAGLAAAYSISEKAFVEYREKVVEKFGEKKEQMVRDEIAQDRVDRFPPNDNTVVIVDDQGVLCYDHFSGRYFKSSMEALRSAENEINHMILQDGYASVSDLYYILGLPVTSFSEEVGWNTDRMLKMVYSTTMSPDNRPCISIDFDLHPNRKYSHFAGE